MIIAMQYVSEIVTFASISALVIPPAVLLFCAKRRRIAAVLLLAGFIVSCLGVLNELSKQQRFFSFVASQGYQQEPMPFFYLPEELLHGLLVTYPIVLVLSAVASIVVACLVNYVRKERRGKVDATR